MDKQLLKIKNFHSSNHNIKRMKRQVAEWKKKFLYYNLQIQQRILIHNKNALQPNTKIMTANP